MSNRLGPKNPEAEARTVSQENSLVDIEMKNLVGKNNVNKMQFDKNDEIIDLTMDNAIDENVCGSNILDTQLCCLLDDVTYIVTKDEPKETEPSPKKQKMECPVDVWDEEFPTSTIADLDYYNTHSIPASSSKLTPKKMEAWDESVTQLNSLFESSQYKREIATVFDNLETTILSVNPDELSMTRRLETTTNITFSTVDWENDVSLLKAQTVSGPEITSAIKQALLNNADSTSKVQVTVNDNVAVFKSLGPFYSLPNKVMDLIKLYKNIDNLYDWQKECLNLDAILKRNNLIYSLPTSGGKSLVSEILILREVLCRKHNALLILPYVSIVQEKVWGLSPFAVALDFLVEEYAAGKGSFPPRKRRHKKSVYIATIEKALGLVNSLIETDRLSELGLVVVDELHLIGEAGRGAVLEILLTKLVFLKCNIQIVGMSATIGNLHELTQFTNGESYTGQFRPVQLVEFVKCGNVLYQNKDEQFMPVRKYGATQTDTVDPDKLGVLVSEVIPEGSCLIFCPSKKNCENVAMLLVRVLNKNLLEHKKQKKENLIRLMKDEGKLCEVLQKVLPYGVAYHHSGITLDERRLIEDSFRSGVLCVICCTSTLAAGVNLPAKRVILRSPYVGRDFITLSRYKQMVGRAGRAGYEEIGESILICESKDRLRVQSLLSSPMDEAVSTLDKDDAKGLKELILSSIGLGIAVTRGRLLEIANSSLLKVQEHRWQVEGFVKKLTDSAISDLFKNGALQVGINANKVTDQNISVLMQSTAENSEEKLLAGNQLVITNGTRLVISKLGKAAIKGGLSLEKAQILYQDLVQAQASLVLLDSLHLLYLVTPYDLASTIKPSFQIYYNIYLSLGSKQLQTAKILGITDACAVTLMRGQPYRHVPERVLNRFYMTLMLHALWHGRAVHQVSEHFDVPRGLVQKLMTSASTFCVSVVRFCEELEEFWPFADVLKGMSVRLQHCTTKELLPLMELPAVKVGRVKQLYKAGYTSLQSIAKADPNELSENIEYMTRRVANQLVAAAKLLLLERVENLREEAEDVLEGIGFS